MPTTTHIANAAVAYVHQGWHLVPIPEGSKGPRGQGWHLLENLVSGPERAARLRGNIGLAHVPSGTFALDVDALEPARAWLGARGVDLDALIAAPDAVAISSGREGRAKLLYKRPAGWTPRTRKPTGSGLEFRCADRSGNSVQDVLPPSVHPDTGEPYTWVVGDLGSIDELPLVPEALRAIVDALNAEGEAPAEEKGALGLTREELRGHLARRDPDGAYDEWLSAGMALHHEARGAPWGLAMWDEWSSKGGKYQGYEDLENRWNGFRVNETDPITARWLLQGDVATAAEFPDETKTKDGKAKATKFRFEHSSTIPVFAPLEWLIPEILPHSQLGVLYGAPGSGKSFIALDMALAIARGSTWRDKHAVQGAVAYVCAEGAAGFRRRYAAYLTANALDPGSVPFWLLDGAPDVHASDHLEINAALAAAGVKPKLIVIDTLARTMGGGDENSGEDMGAYIAHAGRLATLTGAMVLIVHHSGKDVSRGARGHSSLLAAVDAELEVVAGDSWRTLSVTKQKDGEIHDPMMFKLREVTIGMGENEATSCVIEHGPHVSPKHAQVSDRERFTQTLLGAVDECAGVDDGWAEEAEVAVACARHYIHTGTRPEALGKRINTDLQTLVKAGRLVRLDGKVKRA